MVHVNIHIIIFLAVATFYFVDGSEEFIAQPTSDLTFSGSLSNNNNNKNNNSTSLSFPPMDSLRKIILHAFRSVMGAPVQLIRRLAIEIINLIHSHTFRDTLSANNFQQLTAQLPDRLFTYWKVFTEMESQCMNRTICDLSDYTARRLPKWAEQMWLIYLNVFASENSFYTVAINGITTHQCAIMYPECDAEKFLTRIQTNVTESFFSTIASVS